MDFCKEFNARTANHVVGTPLPTYITVSPDKTFKFRFSAPTNSHFIMKCAGVTKGSGTAGAKGSKPVGQISLKHIYEIAKIKSQDEKLQGVPLYGICGSLISSAKGMGIEVVH
jgi:large subunit ribosomal protein L11